MPASTGPLLVLGSSHSPLDYSPEKSLEWGFQNSFTNSELDFQETTWPSLLVKRSRPLYCKLLTLISLPTQESVLSFIYSSFPLTSEKEALRLLLFKVKSSLSASSLTASLINSVCSFVASVSLTINSLLLGFKYSQVSEPLNTTLLAHGNTIPFLHLHLLPNISHINTFRQPLHPPAPFQTWAPGSGWSLRNWCHQNRWPGLAFSCGV